MGPKNCIFIFRFLHFLVNIFNFLKDIVCQLDISFWIFKHFFTYSSEVELNADFLKNIADHELDSFAYQIEVIIFVEFVPTVEDIIDCFHIFCWVAYLIIYDSCLVHQQLMIHKNVLCSQMKGISSKIV